MNKHASISATFHGHEHVLAYVHIDSSRISGVTHPWEEFVSGGAGAPLYSCASGRSDYCTSNEGFVTIDVSGRAYLVWNGEITGRVGTFDTEVAKEFFLDFVREAKVCLHVNLHYGENAHHRIEAVFKSFGRALREACAKDEYLKGVLSTKGVL